MSITNIGQPALPNQLPRLLQERAKVPMRLVITVEPAKLLTRVLGADIGPAPQPRVDLGVGAAQLAKGVQVGGYERPDEQAGGA